jgi:hypothetical protein
MSAFASTVGELLLGWLAADLVTGAFHWWEERLGNENWPIIGPWLIAPNRLHHVDPLAFTRHGFMTRNGAQLLLVGFLGAILLLAFGPSPFLAALIIGSAVSNEVHRYAHQPALAPAWIRVFQQTGLLQSPKGHAGHHRPPWDANFCVLTDWLNPIIEAVRGKRA